MTQEAIGHMLGVRREGVTAAARRLRAAGLIRYARGQIAVIDRSGLETATCECYRVVKSEVEKLLGSGIRPNPAELLPPTRTTLAAR